MGVSLLERQKSLLLACSLDMKKQTIADRRDRDAEEFYEEWREAQGRPTKRQQAKANRQACMVSGKTLEEWRKDRTLWPFPRWRL
jgi:hypothetical protein